MPFRLSVYTRGDFPEFVSECGTFCRLHADAGIRNENAPPHTAKM